MVNKVGISLTAIILVAASAGGYFGYYIPSQDAAADAACLEGCLTNGGNISQVVDGTCECWQTTEICGYPGIPGTEMRKEECQRRCEEFGGEFLGTGIDFNITAPKCNQLCMCSTTISG